MEYRTHSRGFTFIEILVVLAIISILTVASLVTFRSIYRSSAARTAAAEIVNALRDARSRTLSAQNDTVYGVYVSTSSVTRFTGPAYIAGQSSNVVYTFEGGANATGSLVTSGTSIVFSHLTGAPSAVGTLYVRNSDNENTTTIAVGGTGLIE